MDNPKKKKGCGCLGIGCIVLVVLAGIFIGVAVWGYMRLTSYISAHASSSPVTVAVENGTQDEYDAFIKRLDEFKSSVPGSEKTLELSAHDLNLMVKFSPEWEHVRGRLHISVENDQIGLTGSLPLDFVPFAPSLAGKYWNGEMNFTLSLDDRGFHSSVQALRLNGADVSGDDLKSYSTSWTTYLTTNKSQIPVLGPVLMKAKTLTVKDGVIVLTSQ